MLLFLSLLLLLLFCHTFIADFDVNNAVVVLFVVFNIDVLLVVIVVVVAAVSTAVLVVFRVE